MKHHLENYLWDRIRAAGAPGQTPREVIQQMLKDRLIKSPKQAWALKNGLESARPGMNAASPSTSAGRFPKAEAIGNLKEKIRNDPPTMPEPFEG